MGGEEDVVEGDPRGGPIGVNRFQTLGPSKDPLGSLVHSGPGGVPLGVVESSLTLATELGPTPSFPTGRKVSVTVRDRRALRL